MLSRYLPGTGSYLIISSSSSPINLSILFLELKKLILVKTCSGSHSSQVAELGLEPWIFLFGPRASSKTALVLKDASVAKERLPSVTSDVERRMQKTARSVRSAPK